MDSGFHLAQINIARAKDAMDTPTMAGFAAMLEPINELADGTPGFVWRLQDESGDATAIRPYDDERIMVNMSVWESIEALREFVYKSPHVEVFRGRTISRKHALSLRSQPIAALKSSIHLIA